MQSSLAAMYTQVLACLLLLALGTIETGAQKRIIFGSEVKKGEIPFQAVLYYSFGDGADRRSMMCGGSLVHPMWVLTAGHCIDNVVDSLVVTLGVIDMREMIESMQYVDKSARFAHNKYNPSTGENDVGMVKVPKPFVLNAYVQVVAMAPEDIGDLVGLRVMTSGFGRTEMGQQQVPKLKKTELKIISQDECKKAIPSQSNNTITENTICTVYTDDEYSGACSGDSGGPLFTKKDGKPILVGVTSWVIDADECKAAMNNGFMRVSAYRDWIRETMMKGGNQVIE